MTETARITAVVTDLDGTLLDSSKRVSERSCLALARARDAGLRLAVASARPWRLIAEVLGANIASFDAAIVSNGSAIFELPSQRAIAENLITPDHVARLTALLRREWPDAGFGWELGQEFSCDDAFAAIARRQRILREPAAETSDLPLTAVHQLVAACPNRRPAELLDRAARVVGEDYAVTDSEGGVIELSLATVSKSAAAAQWARLVGSSLAELAAFGDGHNDVPILRDAALGVAMGNAGQEARAAACLVAPGNDEDGVAVIIEEILARAPRIGAALRVPRAGTSR
jgi:Cof subfamily protein (haloacid dehalogenase superfamily)